MRTIGSLEGHSGRRVRQRSLGALRSPESRRWQGDSDLSEETRAGSSDELGLTMGWLPGRQRGPTFAINPDPLPLGPFPYPLCPQLDQSALIASPPHPPPSQRGAIPHMALSHTRPIPVSVSKHANPQRTTIGLPRPPRAGPRPFRVSRSGPPWLPATCKLPNRTAINSKWCGVGPVTIPVVRPCKPSEEPCLPQQRQQRPKPNTANRGGNEARSVVLV
jgi:hypothetical protein